MTLTGATWKQVDAHPDTKNHVCLGLDMYAIDMLPNPCRIHAESMQNPCRIHAESSPHPHTHTHTHTHTRTFVVWGTIRSQLQFSIQTS